MDGLHRLVNAPREVKLGDKTYRLSAPPLDFMGELESHVITQRRSPLTVVSEKISSLVLTDHDKELLFRAALRQEATVQQATKADVLEYLDTKEGTAYFFWLMLRKHHPEVDSLKKAQLLIEQQYGENYQVLSAELDKVMGGSEIKNSPEQAPPLETAVQISPLNGADCSAR